MSAVVSISAGPPLRRRPRLPGVGRRALGRLPAASNCRHAAGATAAAGTCGPDGRRRPRGGDQAGAGRQPLSWRGLPQGLGAASPPGLAHLQGAGAPPDARARPLGGHTGGPPPRPTQPRRHDHPREGRRDVGHGHDRGGDDAARPGRRLRRRRSPLGGVHRHPRRPARHASTRRSSRSGRACSSASAASPRTSPRGSRSATTTARSTCPTTSSARSPGPRGCVLVPGLRPSPRGQRLRREVHPDPEGEPALGPDLRHRRGAEAGPPRVPPNLQRTLADRAPRTPLASPVQTRPDRQAAHGRPTANRCLHEPGAVQAAGGAWCATAPGPSGRSRPAWGPCRCAGRRFGTAIAARASRRGSRQ